MFYFYSCFFFISSIIKINIQLVFAGEKAFFVLHCYFYCRYVVLENQYLYLFNIIVFFFIRKKKIVFSYYSK